ncbi:MAG: nucleoside triphosphate pyrophosphohydrolase [Magnetococcales bacterium]|nr:nucleoside triphosphate pyrophosphohydrolase [Magnetococcales bacterium]MBF0157089.1 nucleoside triphosphate pyrophosphohydrolase [Magnetococcales bacterium]
MEALEGLMARLRSPGGCPWDREQDHDTLLLYTLEEAYEVVEAVEAKDPGAIRDELGDLLFHVVFHSRIAEEAGQFRLAEVIRGITAKMIARHPHVFGPQAGSLTEAHEVVDRWESFKAAEQAGSGKQPPPRVGEIPSIFDGLNKRLSALLYAHKMQRRMAKVKFDWPNAHSVLDKLREEVTELAEAIEAGEPEAMADELGDVLLVAVNIANQLNINPETALRKACDKSQRRFRFIEAELHRTGREVAMADLAEMEALWQESKRQGL